MSSFPVDAQTKKEKGKAKLEKKIEENWLMPLDQLCSNLTLYSSLVYANGNYTYNGAPPNKVPDPTTPQDYRCVQMVQKNKEFGEWVCGFNKVDADTDVHLTFNPESPLHITVRDKVSCKRGEHLFIKGKYIGDGSKLELTDVDVSKQPNNALAKRKIKVSTKPALNTILCGVDVKPYVDYINTLTTPVPESGKSDGYTSCAIGIHLFDKEPPTYDGVLSPNYQQRQAMIDRCNGVVPQIQKVYPSRSTCPNVTEGLNPGQ